MFRCIVAVCLWLCFATFSVSAQQMDSASGAEIGTFFGISHLRISGEGGTMIGLPSAFGAFVTGNPAIYVSWFPKERLSMGTEFSLGRVSREGSAVSSLFLACRAGFHSGGSATSGAYLLGRGALRRLSGEASGDSESETDFGLGAGLGYRWRVGSGLVVRAEGGYRRWFDDPGINDFSFLLGLGAESGLVPTDQDIRTLQAEFGTLFGLSRLGFVVDGRTLIGVPAVPFAGLIGVAYPSIYVSWYVNERISIGPEFCIGRTSGDGDANTFFYLAAQGAYHAGGGAASGAYVFGRGALRAISVERSGRSASETDSGLGAGVGYRWRLGRGLVVRAEGGYRRWIDDVGTNELTLLIGLGASLGGS